MKTSKRLIAMLLCLLMLAALFSGCSSKQTEQSETPAAEESPAEAPAAEPSAEETPDAEEEPQGGGTLTIAIEGPIQNLDPYRLNTFKANWVCYQTCDQLVRTDEEGNIIPHLATEWTVSEDGTEYVFTIRDDVYFHPGTVQDGRKMTTEDVAYSLNRFRDNYSGYLNMLEEAVAVDETHVKCTLTAPSPLFLTNLRQNMTAIVCPEELEADPEGYNTKPVLTGAYIVESHDPDVETVLVANPNYWAGTPSVEKIIVKVIPDMNQRVYALQNGDIDIAAALSGDALDSVNNLPNCSIQSGSLTNFATIGMNTSCELLSDERVREAIIMATDYETLFKGTYLHNEADPVRVLVPKSSWAYSETLESYIPEYDPEGAKALLAEAGYPDGFTITLSLVETDNRTRACTIFQQMMKENLNIDVKLEYLESATLIEKQMNYEVELYAGTQTYSIEPADFYGKTMSTSHLGSNYNSWHFSDPEIDALLEEADKSTDQAKRLELYNQVAETVLPQDLAIWYATEPFNHGVSDRVHGFSLNAYADQIIFDPTHNVWVDN